ncbi:unnamed protein product [Rotaria sordida]|uniref:Uncharacterized protein n=2 Tax=Rotaria sordida TaxID=392033 RepID=A0A814KJX0_9BILA|nr:unnamed protein product [Rotaria sordida]
MLGKWFYASYNAKGKFRCLRCMKSGIADIDATWSSAYTTILFRAYYGPDTDENGQQWIGGWIQMKIFPQQYAVQAKFGLIADELAVVWTPMLECIKSKRRNMKAKILKDMKKSDVNNSTSDVRNQPTESISSMQQNVDISDTETNEQF